MGRFTAGKTDPESEHDRFRLLMVHRQRKRQVFAIEPNLDAAAGPAFAVGAANLFQVERIGQQRLVEIDCVAYVPATRQQAGRVDD